MSKKDREIEIRLHNIDEKKIKKILKENGGKKVHKKTLFKIITFNHPVGNQDSFIRLRDEGHIKTMTIKTNLKDKYPIEKEIQINDLEQAQSILKFMGCTVKIESEKIRETWFIEGSKEVVFDAYPGTPTFMEVDCHKEKDLKRILKMLGYNLSEHDSRGASKIYLDNYEITEDREKSKLTFKNANKLLKPLIKKNEKIFNKILKEQLEYLKKNKLN
jgi:adenylate cyclase class IV